MKKVYQKFFFLVVSIGCLLSFQSVSAQKSNMKLTIPFGANNKIIVNLASGTYSVVLDRKEAIKNAYATCKSEEVYDSRNYKTHTYTSNPISNVFGKGTLYTITHNGTHSLQQLFYVFPRKNYFLTELKLQETKATCNYMAPLVADNFELYQNGDNRALFVPFDNDMWVRYNASKLEQANFSSSEVSALYNNDNYKGLIAGSLEQDVWKSAVQVKGKDAASLSQLVLYSGFVDTTITHDRIAHGAVLPQNGYVRSAKFIVGRFDDWRDGMETYAKLNASIEPRYIASWKEATPMGWNSWGVLQTNLSLDKAKSVVDFFADSCKDFRNADNTLFIDLDAFWDNMTPHGLDGDVSQLKEFVRYCKSKGFRPGIYWTPFADWGKSARKIEGSNFNYEETWTRQDGKPIDTDGGRAMDPTHPGTKDRIVYEITRLKNLGFQMIKIDFLGHGAAEGDKFFDPKVTTGMQAFKQGMEFLDSVLDNKMLVYAAISPNMATARYVHSRRIGCDAFSAIDNTEYTLNSTGYGWWQDQLYNFVDADHVVFGDAPDNVNRARLAASIVTGTLITGDDYSSAGKWRLMARKLLQNKDLLTVAKHGKSFRPIEGNTGNKGVNLFTQTLGGKRYIAAFNYTGDAYEFIVPLSRIGVTATNSLQYKELFSGQVATIENDILKIKVEGSDAVILQLQP